MFQKERIMKKACQLYLVTNDSVNKEEDFYQVIETAIKAGVTLVQLREKELSSKEFYERAIRVREITHKYSIPFIINDRLDIALAVNADGVHLGQSDLPIKVAREILGNDKIIGASTKTLEQARIAVEEGADYLGVGAIFPTKTKVITKRTEINTLKDIASTVPVPVVAIGGINAVNIKELQDTDISGVSVVSAIMNEKVENLEHVVGELLSQVRMITSY